MTKDQRIAAALAMIAAGIPGATPVEELVWNEAKVYLGYNEDGQAIKQAIVAMDTMIRTARLVRTRLRRIAKQR